MTSVVITSAARTAIGTFGRSLRDVPPTELGATAARTAVERAGIEPGQVEQVVFGNVIHTSPEDMYLARVVGINAGIPKEAPAMTLNRLCGSGLQAIVSAAQMIHSGDAEVVVAGGGAESMSRGAYWMENRALGRADGGRVAHRRGRRRPHRSVQQDPHGGDRREPGRVARDLPRGAGRVRARVPPPRRSGA